MNADLILTVFFVALVVVLIATMVVFEIRNMLIRRDHSNDVSPGDPHAEWPYVDIGGIVNYGTGQGIYWDLNIDGKRVWQKEGRL